MAKKNIDFESQFEDIPSTEKAKGKKFSYRPSNKKEAVTYTLTQEFVDKIERIAHWKGVSKSQVVDFVLGKHLKNLDVPAIPDRKDNDLLSF